MMENQMLEQIADPQAQKRARVQVEFEKDCLLQWLTLIFLSLNELGIPQVTFCHLPQDHHL